MAEEILNENLTNLEEEDMDTVVTDEYNADDIQVLEGLEAVRKRPGMYIGSTGPRGLHHLVYEIVDNSIDEALAGFCTHIETEILPGNVITVRDNGRGIPTGINEKMGLPAVTVVLTVLHAGGKFGGSGYKVSGGLHGVGSSVVNALSEWMEVEVTQNGHIYAQRFERGIPVNDLHIIGDSDGHRPVCRRDDKPVVFVKGNGLAADRNGVDILLNYGSGHFIAIDLTRFNAFDDRGGGVNDKAVGA